MEDCSIFADGMQESPNNKMIGRYYADFIRSQHCVIEMSEPCVAVVPFVHSGMDKVLPPGTSFPRVGQRVRIAIGKPINFEDLAYQAKVRNECMSVEAQSVVKLWPLLLPV